MFLKVFRLSIEEQEVIALIFLQRKEDCASSSLKHSNMYLLCFFLYLATHLSFYHEKAIKALRPSRLGVASHLFTT